MFYGSYSLDRGISSLFLKAKNTNNSLKDKVSEDKENEKTANTADKNSNDLLKAVSQLDSSLNNLNSNESVAQDSDSKELPEKIKNLIKNETGDPKESEEVEDLLSRIYQDEEGKKLLEKMLVNRTEIEVIDKEDSYYKDGTAAAYCSAEDNKIEIIKGHASMRTLIHEMGHAVTGYQDNRSAFEKLKDYTSNLFDGSKPVPKTQDDGNSMKEEIANDLLVEEITARLEGRTVTKEEYHQLAKARLKRMLTGNGKTYDVYRSLDADNNYYNNISNWTGVDIDYDFDVKELYNELIKEDEDGELLYIPQLI